MSPNILYLHGFGDCHPHRCPIAVSLGQHLPGARLLIPCYHPAGQIKATRIGQALTELQNLIDETGPTPVHLAGYSYGGLLAAILAAQRPERIGNVLLLAPAIDNYARNFAERTAKEWFMPSEYVEELQSYPARPAIVRSTILVHGMLDHDRAGSAPWRIKQWTEEQCFREVHFLEQVDHSLVSWLSPDSKIASERLPTFGKLVQRWLEL